MHLILSEKIIEDILSADISLLSELLSISPSDLNFITRQKILKSGKLDLLYLLKDELLLIELKVVPFYNGMIAQINDYERDLIELQNQNKLIRADIRKVIIVISAKPSDYLNCEKSGIRLIIFDPKDVLTKFYDNFKELSEFLKIQSGDYGVVRLAFLTETIALLNAGKSISEITIIENKSEKTIRNRISVAVLLNLVNKFKNNFYVTDIGVEFIEKRSKLTEYILTEGQVELLSSFVKENPFFSSITYSILTLLESVFVLSKSAYPVPFDTMQDYFVKSVGKSSTWRTERARETATYIFGNYACELEFLSKIDKHFYITPKGIQAILLLQLNRSLKLIGSRK
jgi:hypothetical protein